MDLSGKNVVFVGGFGGIGWNTCKELMTRKLASLYVLDLMKSDEKLEQLQLINKQTRVQYLELDVAKQDNINRCIQQVVAEVKYIDVLINGAGVLNEPRPELTIAINLMGLIHTTMVALPYMAKNEKGRGGLLVNVASVLGLEPCAAVPVYTASKHGVIGFSRSLAHPYYYELTGVAVIAICPGLTITPLVETVVPAFEYSTPVLNEFYENTSQTADICGVNLVKAIETQTNGALCILTDGVLALAEPKKHWPLDN